MVRLSQFWNAPFWISVTLAGMAAQVRAVQSANAPWTIHARQSCTPLKHAFIDSLDAL